jgi:4-hydroxy-3-methylbut-2-enyl diphosphate reductase
MALEIEKAAGIGFCLGVRRAIDILERVAAERGGVETLGAVVHNQPVLRRLANIGVKVIDSVPDIQGDVVVTSSHGVSPQVMEEIRSRNIKVVDTTCTFVKRAQIAARRLTDSGFSTIVYGDADHPEVRGILGWAKGKGTAILDTAEIAQLKKLPRRLGILSQTTQIPACFADFVRGLVESPSFKDTELRIIDTICHDIRQRQANALKLAKESDLVIVVGGHTSANSRHLVELCSTLTETYLVETDDEIQTSWLEGKQLIGVTSGASTDEQTIDEVVTKLEAMA